MSGFFVAYCFVKVIGMGTKDVEMDYFVHVVTCENGAVSMEVLKVQVVVARSYFYYKLDTFGSIGDG